MKKKVIKINESELKNKILEMVLKEVNQNKGFVVTLDFDGTVVTWAYPNIGKDIGAVPVLKKIVENGGKIILDTMRGTETQYGDTLTPAVNWFKQNGIPLWGVQSNPNQNFTNSTKLNADISIDDRNAGAPLINGHIDWKKVEKFLIQKGFIKPSEDSQVSESDLMNDLMEKINEWINDVYDFAWDNEKLLNLTTKLTELLYSGII